MTGTDRSELALGDVFVIETPGRRLQSSERMISRTPRGKTAPLDCGHSCWIASDVGQVVEHPAAAKPCSEALSPPWSHDPTSPP